MIDSVLEIKFLLERTTPFFAPVLPDVKIMTASSLRFLSILKLSSVINIDFIVSSSSVLKLNLDANFLCTKYPANSQRDNILVRSFFDIRGSTNTAMLPLFNIDK